MNRRLLSAALLPPVAIAIVLSANLGAADTESLHHTYCAEVAVWEAEKARGIDPLRRTGHPDYRGIAADHCLGMRPAQ